MGRSTVIPASPRSAPLVPKAPLQRFDRRGERALQCKEFSPGSFTPARARRVTKRVNHTTFVSSP